MIKFLRDYFHPVAKELRAAQAAFREKGICAYISISGRIFVAYTWSLKNNKPKFSHTQVQRIIYTFYKRKLNWSLK